MKITKDEKQLYKLLDVVSKIFGKTEDRTVICGDNNKLYFHTLGYCGVFVSKDDDMRIIDAYDFGTYFYELKQLPNKSFVLDVLDEDVTPESQRRYYTVIDFIDARIDSRKWILETYKDYDYKIAQIAAATNKWIRDEDIPYLKIFMSFEVFDCDDSLIFRGENDLCDIYLIMSGSIVIPDYDDSTQMKIEAYEATDETDDISEEPPEEFEDDNQEVEEDEEDPMA